MSKKSSFILAISIILLICVVLGVKKFYFRTSSDSCFAAINNKKYDIALSECQKAADKGDAKAALKLGTIYKLGLGGNIDVAKAMDWYKKAALGGNITAQKNLGSIYFYARNGYTKDSKEAFKWYKMAAEQGNGSAQELVGEMYMIGDGVKNDNIEGYKWIYLSANQGIGRAKNILDYYGERLTKEEIEEAKKLALEWQAQHQSGALEEKE